MRLQRAGGIAWATIIFVGLLFFRDYTFRSNLIDRTIIITLQLYSLVGGIILFKYGPFLFFVYPEWYGIASTL